MTLPFAPQLVDLKSKVASQAWNLGPKTTKMFTLNELIKAENRVSARYSDIGQSRHMQSAPKYHAGGLTSDPRATRLHEHPGNWFSRISGFRLQDWREHQLEHKLDFNDKVRLRAGRCAMKYFLKMYGFIEHERNAESSSDSSSDSSDESSDISSEE